MTFDDVLNDVKKLVGLKLSSIRPGAEITILLIDEEQDNLVLMTSSGTKRSRPLRELRTIWSLLLQNPVVHVDEALHGSGTSRNQPETILANLPYIEWLKVNGKKNLAFVNHNTHPFGTLKEMDVFKAEELLTTEINRGIVNAPYGLIITDDISGLVSSMNKKSSGTTDTLMNGLYLYTNDRGSFMIGTKALGLPNGTYLIVRARKLPGEGTKVIIANKEYELFNENGASILLTI